MSEANVTPQDAVGGLGRTPIVEEVGWLKGLRVVEVTTAVSAPLISRVLSEMGAEVIKVESRAKIDVNRARVPRPTDPEGFPAHEAFQLLHEANAGKRSVTLNLKTDEGKQLFLDLLGDADVFIENFVPGWLDRLGLSIEMLREHNPRLIILSASGYGQTGPMRTQRAYAPVMTALAGVEGLIGYEDGSVMGCSSLALADLNCSFSGVHVVMSALVGRQQSGEGTHIDLSQIEAAAILTGEAFVEQQLYKTEPGPVGNVGPDGKRWSMLEDPDSGEWVGVADESVSVEKGRSTTSDILTALKERGVEVAPIVTPAQVAEDEKYLSRGFIQSVEHPLEAIGDLTITSVPWRLEGSVPKVGGAAPLLGSANEDVLSRYITAEQISQYEDEGALR